MDLPVWYFPAHNGDFRLTKRGDECTIVAHDVTPAEAEILARFGLKGGRSWFGRVDVCEPKFWLEQNRELALDVSVEKAGKLLLKLSRPKKSTLTAVAYADGKVTVSEGVDETVIDKMMETAKDTAKEAPRAAASVARPTPCCPVCIPGANVRASEVLAAFMTPEQHAQWSTQRALIAVGNLTGHRYVIAHRGSARAVQQTKICKDLDDAAWLGPVPRAGVLHFHDWSVPPEEEVLAAKLILEHREHWLRNEATRDYGFPAREFFKNPFGDITDGVPDRNLTECIGELARGLLV